MIRPTRLRRALAMVAAAGALVMTGCAVPSFLGGGGSARSEPTGERVATYCDTIAPEYKKTAHDKHPPR